MTRVRYTTESFISLAHEVHGNKYTYPRTVYVRDADKVIITCPKHGDFLQKANKHKMGDGCPECGEISRVLKRTHTLEKFLEKAKEIHGERYDYSRVKYVNNKVKVEIICPLHGSFFPTPDNHLNKKSGCRKCSYKTVQLKLVKTKEQFVKDARKTHGSLYDYSQAVYISNAKNLEIVCVEHGAFYQTPINHIGGTGCPECSIKVSRMEKDARAVLKQLGLKFIAEKKFKDLGKLRYDFYIPSLNLLIEMDGEQHFKPVKFFGGVKGFNARKKRDNLKTQYAKEKGIRLLRIPYNAKPSPRTLLRRKLRGLMQA